MQKKLLKTSLFGFSKTDVCEYIAKMNAEFNDKIDAINAGYAEEKRVLSEEISSLTAEIEKYKQAHGDIAQALFDAQQYASELKAKSDNEYKTAANELLILKETETEKLNTYRNKIESIRKDIVSLLIEIDNKLESRTEQTEDLIAEYNSEEGIIL